MSPGNKTHSRSVPRNGEEVSQLRFPAGAADIWLGVPEEVDERGMSGLSSAERNRVRLLRDRAAASYAAAHVKLRRILGGYLGVDPGEVRLGRTLCPECGDLAHGPPAVVWPATRLTFNPSCADGFCAARRERGPPARRRPGGRAPDRPRAHRPAGLHRTRAGPPARAAARGPAGDLPAVLDQEGGRGQGPPAARSRRAGPPRAPRALARSAWPGSTRSGRICAPAACASGWPPPPADPAAGADPLGPPRTSPPPRPFPSTARPEMTLRGTARPRPTCWTPSWATRGTRPTRLDSPASWLPTSSRRCPLRGSVDSTCSD